MEPGGDREQGGEEEEEGPEDGLLFRVRQDHGRGRVLLQDGQDSILHLRPGVLSLQCDLHHRLRNLSDGH